MDKSLIHLMRLAQKNASALYEKNFSGYEPLSLPQIEVLSTLMQKGPLLQKTICKFCGVDRSTLSLLLQVLVRRGFVGCVRSESDMRNIMVTITPKGRDALKHGMKAVAIAESQIIKHLPGGKRALTIALRCVAEMRVEND